MNSLDRGQFKSLLETARIKKRLQRELRFVPEEISDWEVRDFLAVTTKSGNEGVLLYEDFVLPFTMTARAANAKGRVEAIICDICATWRRGTDSATITFAKSPKNSVTHLVCADLNCSLHVRNLTAAAQLSRVQLREHIDESERIERLQQRLTVICSDIIRNSRI